MADVLTNIVSGLGSRNGKFCEVTRQQTLIGGWNGGILW